VGAYPAGDLDEAWKLTLLHQFHDILPGSSIAWVYQEAARDHQRVCELASSAIAAATEAIAARVDTEGFGAPMLVFNASSFDRAEVVEVGGSLQVVSVPACGYAVVDAARPSQATDDPVITGSNTMENAVLRLRWDGDGLLTSVYDKQAQREVLAAGERGNLLQLFRDHPTDYDAWEIDADDLQEPQALTACESIEMVESTPLRAAVRVVRRIGASTVTQTMVLRSGSRRVDFETTVDWHETHRLLKVAFPVAVRAPRAAFDVGFGHVERSTHENTSWDAAQFEVPAHRFADLSEHGYGVALLNDSKHGYDVRGSTLRLTLLRAPTMPDPGADRGLHRFTYALLPHPGDLVAGGVVAAAEALDLPLRCVTTSPHPGDLPRSGTAVRVDGPGVAVTAVKKSERGEAIVVRMCEVAGGRTTARVAPRMAAAAAARCDLLERPVAALALTDGAVQIELGPFQLATLRFEVR
jgi:alpha-mannosidase